MTRTDTSRLPVMAEHSRPRLHALALVAAIAGGVTLLIRLALHDRSFDLFGDEIIYTDVGRSVVNGGFPRFGGPFFLHGPGFFYLEAGWQRLLGNQPGVTAQVDQMRMLNAFLAAVTAVVLVLLAARAGSLRAGAAAGLLFAMDPFCIRQNDRALLETALMLWVLLGYLVFTSLLGRLPGQRDWLRAVGAGLLFGVAVLTKDEGALLTILPLLAAAALRWGPRQGLTLLTVGTTVAVYAAYVTVVWVNGYFGLLWQATVAGIQRMLGLTQTTGFHSSGGGSLTDRLIAEGADFVTTYLVLALAGAALVLLLRRGGPVPRILALLYCAAGVALGYAVVKGTLEEQELYLLIIPSVMIIPVAATLLRGGSRDPKWPAPERRHGMRRTAVITTALVLAFSLNVRTFVEWLWRPDDGFANLFSFMATHVPPGARVTAAAGSEDIAFYALAGRYSVGLWPTPAAVTRNHVRYVLVEWAEINEGYSSLTAADVRRLVVHAQPVFSFRGRTYGDLQLFRMPPSRGRPPARPLTDGAAPPIAPVAAVPGRQ